MTDETVTLEVLGTGSGLNIMLGNTSFLVRGKERMLLIDCGYTVPLELMRRGCHSDVTDIMLTHCHADHIGGIEWLSFMNFFKLGKRGERRPYLHVATDAFAQELWNHSLKGGLAYAQDDNNHQYIATLDDFFKVNVGRTVSVEGLPKLHFFPTQHVQGMENYGIDIGTSHSYSGDSIEACNRRGRVVLQDCQFQETKSDVHIPYGRLCREVPVEMRRSMHLIHLGQGWERIDPKDDGFAGYAQAHQRFRIV